MEKIKNKLNNNAGIFSTFVCWCVAAILIISSATMGFLNLTFNDEFYVNFAVADFKIDSILNFLKNNVGLVSLIIGLVVFAGVSGLLCFVMKIIHKPRKLIYTACFGVIAAVILRMMAAAMWQIELESDFKTTYDMAQLLNTIPIGYWSKFIPEIGSPYSGIWSANLPFILYEALMIKCNINLYLMNVLFGSATCLFAAMSAKEIFGKEAFINTLMFTALNPLMILYTSVLTNQHISVMLFMISIWIVIKFRNWIGAVIGAVFVAAAQLMRPDMYVAVIGIVLYYIYYSVKNKKYLGNWILFLVVFVMSIAIVDTVMNKNGMIDGHIYDGNMKYKIAVGLNKETKGAWSQSDSLLISEEDKLNDLFWERITQTGNIPLMIQKTAYQFGSYVYPWIMKLDTNPDFSNIICRRTVSAYMILMIILASIILIKDKEHRIRLFPIFIIIAGYMAAYALIEIQPRYNYIIIPLITIAGSNIKLE